MTAVRVSVPECTPGGKKKNKALQEGHRRIGKNRRCSKTTSTTTNYAAQVLRPNGGTPVGKIQNTELRDWFGAKLKHRKAGARAVLVFPQRSRLPAPDDFASPRSGDDDHSRFIIATMPLIFRTKGSEEDGLARFNRWPPLSCQYALRFYR